MLVKKIPDYIRWAAFLGLKDFSKVPLVMKVIFNESECKKVMDKMKKLESDNDFLSIAEIQDLYEQSYDRGLYKAEQEGIKCGEGLGIIKTIKSMLKNQANYNLISKVTGKNQEVIRKIEQSINLG
jgi:hypothetical protein